MDPVKKIEIKQNIYGKVVTIEDAVKLTYEDSILITELDTAWKTISFKEQMTEGFIIENINKLDHRLLLENPNIEITKAIEVLLKLT